MSARQDGGISEWPEVLSFIWKRCPWPLSLSEKEFIDWLELKPLEGNTGEVSLALK